MKKSVKSGFSQRASKNRKQGLSPLVATVLLIVLSLVLASIVFMWARGFISEQIQKGGKNVDAVCEQSVNFDVEANMVSPNRVRVIIQNIGNINIYDFEVGLVSGGNVQRERWNIKVDKGKSAVKEIIIDGDEERIVFYPIILGNIVGSNRNKESVCLNKFKSINVLNL
jgi:hypothetical protein